MEKPENFWEPDTDDPPQPGLSDSQLDEWESTHGVRLPKVLRNVLKIQNGGAIRLTGKETFLWSLEAIVRPDEYYDADFWDEYPEESKRFKDRQQTFFFAGNDTGDCTS